MVAVCAAPNCPRKKPTTNINTRSQSVQFHRFPLKNPNLLKKWLSAMGTPDSKPSINTYLCSTHFKEYDYEKRGNQKILKPNSVPSIFKQQTIERDTLTESDESGTASGTAEKLEEGNDSPQYILEDEEETANYYVSNKSTKKEKKIVQVQSQLSNLLGPAGDNAPLVLIVGDDGEISSEYILKNERDLEIDDEKPDVESLQHLEAVDNEILVVNNETMSEPFRYTESIKKCSQTATKPKENLSNIQIFNDAENKDVKIQEEKLVLSRQKVKRLYKRCKKTEKKVRELKLLLKMLVLKRGKGVKNLSQLFEEYAEN